MRKTYRLIWPPTQREPVPGKPMVRNHAGGYGFGLDDWRRLERFLILGSDGGTYYVRERALTLDNAEAVQRCLAADGARVVRTVVKLSTEGRAPRNDPALFALAVAISRGDAATKRAAAEALGAVARTGTHLFAFIQYARALRGWGRLLREAVAAWYLSREPDALAYQAVKYRQRDGMSHRDALRLCHAVPDGPTRNAVFAAMVRGEIGDDAPALLRAAELARRPETPEAEVIRVITEARLPWETVASEHLRSPKVWEALLPHTPLEATVRNLGRLTHLGLLTPLSDLSRTLAARIANGEYVRKSRLHPLKVLVAQRTYAQGFGERGALSWTPVTALVNALDAAFYAAFASVEPTGKRTLLALDVSGSMMAPLAGLPLTCREAAAAMALVTAATESQTACMAFCHEFVPLDISPQQRLADVVRRTEQLPFGGTDCALPMIWAREQQVPVDSFVIYTDCETWAGQVHPFTALAQYRQAMGLSAKLVVVGLAATGFTIADPDDGGMLDVVGFDTATPAVIADFLR